MGRFIPPGQQPTLAQVLQRPANEPVEGEGMGGLGLLGAAGVVGGGGKLSNLGEYGRFKYGELLQDIGEQQARAFRSKKFRGRPFTTRQLDATAQLELLADEINKFPETSYQPVPSLEMLMEAIKMGYPVTK